jgi:outer membrane protein TolC
MRTKLKATKEEPWILACLLALVLAIPTPAFAQKPLPRNTAPAESAQPQDDADMGEESPETSQILRLEEAYQLALTNEEQLKIAARELAKAQLLPWRAVTLLTPRAEISGIFTRNKEEISFTQQQTLPGQTNTSVIRPLESWQGTFILTQPILQPSFLPTYRLGKETVQQSKQQYGFTVREILFGVARAYYDALRSREQVRVARDTLTLTTDELRQAQARFRVGEVTKTDVLRAEVEVARAERALIGNRNALQLAFATLARVVGVHEPVRVAEPTPLVSRGEPYDRLVEKAYGQRQDLRAQASAIAASRERKNQVLARYVPQINTQWQYPRLDSPTFANRDKFWVLTLNFQVPIFDGGVRELDLLEQQENLTQSELQLERLKKDIGIEVKQTLLEVATLESTLETLKKEVSLAQENYKITSKQYAVGLATSLDVNTAVNTLNQVRTQLIDQTYAYQVALLALDRAVGIFGQDYVSQR